MTAQNKGSERCIINCLLYIIYSPVCIMSSTFISLPTMLLASMNPAARCCFVECGQSSKGLKSKESPGSSSVA